MSNSAPEHNSKTSCSRYSMIYMFQNIHFHFHCQAQLFYLVSLGVREHVLLSRWVQLRVMSNTCTAGSNPVWTNFFQNFGDVVLGKVVNTHIKPFLKEQGSCLFKELFANIWSRPIPVKKSCWHTDFFALFLHTLYYSYRLVGFGIGTTLY